MSMSPEAPAATARSRDVYSVSRLNREVRVLLERGMGVVWVAGELSNLSQPASGHWYFSLKDRNAQLRCAMYRAKNALVGFTPRAGMQVLVRGRISFYEPKGECQLAVEHLEEEGVGALKREFERLKNQLAAEGLFALQRKRALPRFPRRIGVITSPSGAALHDILHILARRYPPAAVLIYSTPVQGAAAAQSLVAALRLASSRAECDVLILARGGGSLEDLWAFNDERVARAIHACAVPVVCGIGHETDFTIADFVADARAPTPSAAAELVVPDRLACLDAVARTAQRLGSCMRRELRANGARLEAGTRRLMQAHPGVRLLQQTQRLDDLGLRLSGALRAALMTEARRYAEAHGRLRHHSPERALAAWCARTQDLRARIGHAMQQQLARTGHRLALAQRALDAVSPLATLGRGFAIVTDSKGRLLTDATAVPGGAAIEARLARGVLTARVTGRK
jgi:exodeoxyribonuclease VII large subunit